VFKFFPTLLALAVAGHASGASLLENFSGKFLQKGKITVSDGSGIAARGKNKIRFTPSTSGESARLTITGELRVNGVPRAFSNVVIFRKENVAAISNLAPGIDDGYSVEEGSYTAGARRIRANFPFVFGTTAGAVNVVIRVEKNSRATRLHITQTLTSNALMSPITWHFTARGRP
jgi:hypothetical protein